MAYRDNDSFDLPLLNEELSEKSSHADTPVPIRSLLESRCSNKTSTHRRNLVIATLTSSLVSMLITLCILGAAYRYQRSQPLKWEALVDDTRPGTASCGETTEEALARGCIFDELSMNYMPTKCTSRYNEEYLVANGGGPFLYWFDRHGKKPLDDPKRHVGNGTFFWTTTRNHLVHCQYNLYRLADALKSGEYIAHDNALSLSDHMHHCVMTMTEYALKAPAKELDTTDVVTEPGFGYC